MQAGHDESVAPRPRQQRVSFAVGVTLVAIGLLLLAGVGSYYGYAAYARSQLDELNFTVYEHATDLPTSPSDAALERPSAPPTSRYNRTYESTADDTPSGTYESTVPETPSRTYESAVPDTPSRTYDFPNSNADASGPVQNAASVSISEPAETYEPPTQDAITTDLLSDPHSPPSPAPADVKPSATPTLPFASVYPGVQMHPKYWAKSIWAGADPYSVQERGLPEGYRPLPSPDAALRQGTAAAALRIRIPLIGLDSEVTELRILDLGVSRQYETPNNVVGHIPKTANPGESGNGWFFGHLESPVKGEGNVFGRLPKIPGYLKYGDAVYVGIESENGDYLYQVIETRVVHQDDLRINDREGSNITLVTCVPRLTYDHRLLVTAKLVGFRG